MSRRQELADELSRYITQGAMLSEQRQRLEKLFDGVTVSNHEVNQASFAQREWQDAFREWLLANCQPIYAELQSARPEKVEHPGSPCPHGKPHELDGICATCDCGKPTHSDCCKFVVSMLRGGLIQQSALADRVQELIEENAARASMRPEAPRIEIKPIGLVKMLKDQRDEVATVLRELVYLKTLKDGFGEEPFGSHNARPMRAEYERRQPLAWQAARAILAKCPDHEQQLRNICSGLGMTREELQAALDSVPSPLRQIKPSKKCDGKWTECPVSSCREMQTCLQQQPLPQPCR